MVICTTALVREHLTLHIIDWSREIVCVQKLTERKQRFHGRCRRLVLRRGGRRSLINNRRCM